MTTQEAFAKLNENQELAAKTKAECKTPEQVYDVLKSVGLTDSFDDFKKAAAQINESVTKLDKTDVDAIVGGGDTITTVTITTTASIAAAAAI
ncbi:MAG: hypothetical protein K6E63_03075 [Lachnospiraceae bacterium]|nr:hypothetical protein [Lachnospiraceae bacterium]